VGAELVLDALPRPHGVALERWLTTFPSFGFLLAVPARHVAELHARCRALGLESASVGTFQAGRRVELVQAGERALFWDLAHEPFTGFGAELPEPRA
jgi:selenophosphate synthetase-related protein